MISLRRVFFILVFLFLCTVDCVGQTFEYEQLEEAVYREMTPFRSTGNKLCAQFGVDPRILQACIYIEMVQYELDPVRKVKKALEGPMLGWQTATGTPFWPNLSLGFAHIKPAFAQETYRRLREIPQWKDFLGNKEIGPLYYSRHPETCLKIAAAGLFLLQKEWKDAGFDISGRPEILGTLYNLGYSKSQPKAQPQAGGTELPIIMDGKLITNLGFGDKITLLLAAGRKMAVYLRG